MDVLSDLNITTKLFIASLATEPSSWDALFRSSTGEVTKRVLGNMSLQDTGNYYNQTASNARFLQNCTISLPTIFNVTTSNAIPAAPNLVAVLANQTANTVFAAPNGSTGTPSFRALVAGDIPAIAISGITGLQTALDAKISGSGTSGYLAKYTGGLTQGNSILFESSSKIGIGNTSPGVTLHLGAGTNLTIADGAGSIISAQILNSQTSGVSAIATGVNDGTNNRRAGIFVDQANAVAGISTYYSSGGGIPFVFRNAAGENMRIAANGNVGIGTNAPGYLLDIAGTGHFTGNVTFDANAILATAPTTGSHLVNKTYADLKLLAPTSGPSSGQFVKYNGSANIWATLAIGDITGLQTALDTKLSGAGTTNYVSKYSAAGTLAVSQIFDNDTNVGIGTVSPAYKLDVSGTGHFSGNVTFDGNALIVTAPSSGSHAVNKTYADLKLLAPTSSPITGQYVKYNGSANVWASVAISEVSGLQTALDGKFGGSGTTTYIPKYTGSFTQGNSMMIDDGAAVGVNTNLALSRSDYRLIVRGFVIADSITLGTPDYGLTIDMAPVLSSFASIGTGANTLRCYAVESHTWVYGALVQGMKLNSDGLKIGTGSASYKLDVAGSVGWTGSLYVGNPDVSVSMSNGTDGQVLMRTTVSSTAVNQWQSLAISGITGLQTALDAKISGSGTSGYLAKYTGGLTQGNSILFESGSKIGIGNTSPGVTLHLGAGTNLTIADGAGSIISAQILNSQTSGVAAIVTGVNDGTNNRRAGIFVDQANAVAGISTYYSSGGNIPFVFRNASGENMRIAANGRLGIGTNNPGYLLDVAGTGRFTGAVLFDAIPSTPIAATSANHIVNYATMQSYVSGIKYDSVKVKTVALANITLSGHQTINGYTTSGSDRVLVMGQSTASQNGVYISNSSTWTRDTNFDSDTELRGFIHSVESGSNAGYKYINTNATTITVGSTAINYVEFSSLVETDPVFTASVAYGITSTNISNWNDAYTNRISTKTTSDLAEGSNLYFTTARVLATALTGLSTGTNAAITASDTVLSAFQNVQAQINTRLIMGGNTTGAAITIGTNDNYDFNLERNNAVQMTIKSGVIEANFDFDVKGKLKLNGSTGTSGQFVKYNGTNTVWSGLSTTDLSDNGNLIKLTTIAGERGFQLFSTDPAYANAFVWSNDDAGIALALHGYSVDSSDAIKEFGLQLDTDGLLYHKRLNGSRSQIATIDMISGGSGGFWNGGPISGDIDMNINRNIYWDKNSSSSAFIGYNILALVVPQKKLFSVHSDGDLAIGSSDDLYIGGDRVLIQKGSGAQVELDLSGANSFSDGHYLRFQVSSSGGIKKLTLVSD